MSRLLVVEDNQDLCEVLSQLLTWQGWEVVTASDGLKAIEHLKSDHFDVVLSDIEMPRLNGVELLKVIKIVWPETRVILMTGNFDLSNYRQHLSGAEFVFQKGRSFEELFAKIDSVTSETRQLTLPR